MEWVHCNVCFVQPSEQESHRFIITSCGHIYCTQCVEKVPREKCQICERAFETTELNSEITGDVREFFQEPMSMINKAITIATFQQGHRVRFFNRLRSSHLKYGVLKAETMKIYKENQILQKKIKHTELELGWYKNELRTMKQKLNEARRLSTHPVLNECGVSPAPSQPSQHRRVTDAIPSSSQYFFDNTPKSQLSSCATPFMDTRRYRADPVSSGRTNYSTLSTDGISPQFLSQRNSGNSSCATPLSGNVLRQSNSLRGSQSQFNTPSGFSTPGLMHRMTLSDRSQEDEKQDQSTEAR